MFPECPSRESADRQSRRAFLRAGSLAGLGLGLAPFWCTRQATAGEGRFGAARRCILLFLTGGPPQHDTFDPKPSAPAEIRGELAPIATSIPGVHFSELFPRLARAAGSLAIVRSVTHHDTVHTSAGYSMLTGADHPTPNEPSAEKIRPSPNDHPHVGSLVAWSRAASGDLPPFVSLPEVIRDANVNTFPGQTEGFLPRSTGPFLVEADAARERLLMPEVVLPADVPHARAAYREALWRAMDRSARRLESASTRPLDDHYVRAFEMLRSPRARRAFDVESEPAEVRREYGSHLFGQGCLMARRLIESGVDLVTVYWHYEGPDDSPVWDTHQNNFQNLRQRLASPTDQAVSALIGDLGRRGLLEETLVVCMGEFGRTPRINGQAGRDHWPQVQSILLAGGGVAGGQVVGASDAEGAFPAQRPVSPADLAATLLHLLGVPPELELTDRQGRRLPAIRGTPVLELWS
jgi:hypothetical protein